MLERLIATDGAGATEAEQIDHIALLEKLKGAAAAAQARVTDISRWPAPIARPSAACRPRSVARAWPPRSRWRGAAVLTAVRRPWASRGAVVREMPDTHALLSRGEISEWRATLVVRETAVLSVEHRAQVDAELAPELAHLGDREAAARARAIGYRLDPGSAIRRTAAHGPTDTSACGPLRTR